MKFETLVFYFLSAVLLYAAVRVVTLRNPVHAALHLVLAFFSASGLWVLLRAEFLALVLTLVYVGSVTVLFLFVVMMLDIHADQLRGGFRKHKGMGMGVALLMIAEMAGVFHARFSGNVEGAVPPFGPEYSNVKEIGHLLLTRYAYAFELASVILLTGVIAAVALTLRGRQKSKSADPSEQVFVKAEERIRLLQMPSEKTE